jgi:hypothetical protein
MTWHCESCGTTLTYTGLDGFNTTPGMMKCPRCDKWMERVTDSR